MSGSEGNRLSAHQTAEPARWIPASSQFPPIQPATEFRFCESKATLDRLITGDKFMKVVYGSFLWIALLFPITAFALQNSPSSQMIAANELFSSHKWEAAAK